MKLQSIQLPRTGICTEEKMYFRRGGAIDFAWDKDYIVMSHDSTILFDTYFNGCSAEKWFKYTKIKKISINLHVRGKFRITLMRKEKSLDGSITKFLSEQTFGEPDVEGEYSFPFESESNSGMFCFQILCLSDGSIFYDGFYDGEVSDNDISYVKIALDICTFKREIFVKKNIQALNSHIMCNEASPMMGHLEIFISDNAGTLKDEEVILNDKIHMVKNKNTGGAGGFTRGMIEASKLKKSHNLTHILVMDDDVIINPDSIYRTFVILSLLKEEYKDSFIGGAMLRLDKQYIQTENGARWNKGYLISHKSGLNLLDVDACLYNEFEEKTEFNAWWYCAFPMDVITDTNLPLPIFIRGDDVEYGLRNLKHLILMNGICVWHEPFENKYSSSMYYYIFRNRLIDNSIHKMNYKRKDFIRDLRRQVKAEIIYYRYKNADLLINGVNDFFNGIDWFMQQDGQELHQRIMQKGYKLQDINDLSMPFSYPAYEQSCRTPEPTLRQRLIRKLTYNGILLPSVKKEDNEMPVVAPTFTARPVNFYRVDKVLNYDYCSRRGFVTQKSLKETMRLLYKMKKISIKSRYKYKRTVKQYEQRGKELMSIEFWTKYLDL